jgi:hypothetical protein
MSGAASGSRRNLVGWIRLDSNGNIIPGSVQYRPRGVQPKDGIWRQITSSYCCDCNCIITFRSTATVGDVTSIVSADSSIDWTGTLTDGDTISFVIPNCYNEVFTMTFGTLTGDAAVSVTTVQGEATAIVSGSPAGTGESVTITTPVPTSQCAQYLVTIVDD